MVLRVIRYFAVLGAALVVLYGSCEGSAFAQALAGPAGDRPPVTIKLGTDEITVGADGSYTHISHYEITPSNDSVAKNLAQQAFAFSEATDDLQVTEAYTLKSDGRKETVDPTHIFVQSPQGSSQAPMFDDVKRKVVVFPDEVRLPTEMASATMPDTKRDRAWSKASGRRPRAPTRGPSLSATPPRTQPAPTPSSKRWRGLA